MQNTVGGAKYEVATIIMQMLRQCRQDGLVWGQKARPAVDGASRSAAG